MSLADDLRQSPLFSEELGLDLASRDEREIFKWFLASMLYGARITAPIAALTYRAFERHALLTPAAILAAGWDYLVHTIMREGRYVRYDESKSRQILEVCRQLQATYDGRRPRNSRPVPSTAPAAEAHAGPTRSPARGAHGP